MLTNACLTLSHGESMCTILPHIGGGLGGWSIGNQQLLRHADAQAVTARDPLGLASFPLVPYSNRISMGHFEWAGQKFALAANHPPEPHAIHGVGWQRDWAVDSAQGNCASLSLMHLPDAHWPWPFEARQVITLTSHSLTLALSARNLADVALPLAFGHHPYFDAEGASLAFAADHVWMSVEDARPTEPLVPVRQFDFSRQASVADRDIDHCYTGVSGKARVSWQGRRLALEIGSAPQLPAAVIYIPKGGDYFCYEPVPHINNALNLPAHHPAMPVIAPGACFETSITFEAVPA